MTTETCAFEKDAQGGKVHISNLHKTLLKCVRNVFKLFLKFKKDAHNAIYIYLEQETVLFL